MASRLFFFFFFFPLCLLLLCLLCLRLSSFPLLGHRLLRWWGLPLQHGLAGIFAHDRANQCSFILLLSMTVVIVIVRVRLDENLVCAVVPRHHPPHVEEAGHQVHICDMERRFD